MPLYHSSTEPGMVNYALRVITASTSRWQLQFDFIIEMPKVVLVGIQAVEKSHDIFDSWGVILLIIFKPPSPHHIWIWHWDPSHSQLKHVKTKFTFRQKNDMIKFDQHELTHVHLLHFVALRPFQLVVLHKLVWLPCDRSHKQTMKT